MANTNDDNQFRLMILSQPVGAPLWGGDLDLIMEVAGVIPVPACFEPNDLLLSIAKQENVQVDVVDPHKWVDITADELLKLHQAGNRIMGRLAETPLR